MKQVQVNLNLKQRQCCYIAMTGLHGFLKTMSVIKIG